MSAALLLVDDEQAFVDALAERLRVRGFEAESVYDATQALERLSQGGVDAVVLDVQMPGKNGLDALEEMKALDPSVQVILLTGRASLDTAVEGMKRGAFDYLVKPADINRLMEVLSKALDNRTRQAEGLRMLETAKLAAIGQLAQGVAHEINNPLAVIADTAGWILDCMDERGASFCEDLAEARAALADIGRHSRRCTEITRKLMRFAGKIDHRVRELRLGEVVGACMQAITPRAQAMGVRLEAQVPPDLPVLTLSRAELEEVFRNLLDNALDAMSGRRGVVRVTAELLAPVAAGGAPAAPGETSPMVEVRVSDEGHGIAEADRPRIFEPFFSTKDVGQGTGLGLAICYGIITSLGGTLAYESHVGEGTTFRFTIPLARRKPA